MAALFTAKEVEAAPIGRRPIHGSPGLYILTKTNKDGTISRNWIHRYRLGTARRDMGLGTFPAVTLSQARLAHTQNRALLAKKIDPLDKPPVTKKAQVFTLRQEALAYRTRKAPRYDAAGKRVGGWCEAYYREWLPLLERYVLGAFPTCDSGEITGAQIAAVLSPIWHRPIGFRVATTLNAIFKSAVGLNENKHRLSHNPMNDAFAKLPAIDEKERAKQVRPHGMMTASDVAVLYKKTDAAAIHDLPPKALQFLLLLGSVRSAVVLGMRWGEIDGDVFTVPGSRNKSGNACVIPLVDEAVKLLAELPRHNEFVFPSLRERSVRQTKDGRPFVFSGHLQDDAMRIWLQAHHPGIDAVTGKPWDVHGLRHAYTGWVRGWASVETYWDAEFGLDHANREQSKVQRAYDRSARLPERRAILTKWAAFLSAT